MDDATCPVCLDTIFPAEEVSISLCQPTAHYCHLACWNVQTNQQKERCPVCRQCEVGEMVLSGVERHVGFVYDPGRYEVFQDLPPAAQVLIRQFQLGLVTEDEIWELPEAR